jgi:hypothetical protein
MSAVFVRVMAEEKGFTPRVIDVLVNVDNTTVELRILIQVDHKAFGRTHNPTDYIPEYRLWQVE